VRRPRNLSRCAGRFRRELGRPNGGVASRIGIGFDLLNRRDPGFVLLDDMASQRSGRQAKRNEENGVS